MDDRSASRLPRRSNRIAADARMLALDFATDVRNYLDRVLAGDETPTPPALMAAARMLAQAAAVTGLALDADQLDEVGR